MRIVIVVIWLAVVSLAWFGIGSGSDSVFARVLVVGGLPLLSKRRCTASMSRQDMLVGLATVVVLFALIRWSAWSGFTAASHLTWLDKPDIRAMVAFGCWVATLTVGIRAFLAGRFLTDHS